MTKKVLAGALGTLLLFVCSFVPMARAQGLMGGPNVVGRFDSNAIGGVSYSMNSGGTSYGQIFNSGSSSLWSLGFGTSQSASGTAVLSWNASGQVGVGTTAPASSSLLEVGTGNGAAESVRVTTKGLLEFHATTVPTLASCGTGPSVVSGSDQVGDFTIGSAAVATCTLTFASAFTNIPHCFVNNRTSKLVALAQPTASTLVIVGTGAGGYANTGDIIDYFCAGHN